MSKRSVFNLMLDVLMVFVCFIKTKGNLFRSFVKWTIPIWSTLPCMDDGVVMHGVMHSFEACDTEQSLTNIFTVVADMVQLWKKKEEKER